MALPENEQELKTLRAQTLKEIERRGGKEKAPNFAKRLNDIDAQLNKVRAMGKSNNPTSAAAPASPSAPAVDPKLLAERTQIQKEIDRRGGPEKAPGFVAKLQDVQQKIDNAPTAAAAPISTAPTSSAPISDQSAGGATTGIQTGNLPKGIPNELLEGLNLGKALYPDGSLGRVPNPAPIGPLGAFEKVGMIDVNGIPKVSVIDTTKIPKVGAIDPNSIPNVAGVTQSEIPQIKEISEAINSGLVKSVDQWGDYYEKTKQRDAATDAAIARGGEMASKGYSSQDMQAKRAMANAEIDNQTQTALRDMRAAQGAAGNFGGVAAARQKSLTKDSLLRKAMNESALLAGEADYRLKANTETGNLANTAYQTYNQTQNSALTGLSNSRTTAAEEALKRQMANQDAQKGNQSAFLEGASQRLTADVANQGTATTVAKANQDAEASNASNFISGESVRGQQEGTNASNAVEVARGNQTAQGTNAQISTQRDVANADIAGGNLDRAQNATIANMGQSEKEKALQSGTGIGYWQFLSAEEQQRVINQMNQKLTEATAKGL